MVEAIVSEGLERLDLPAQPPRASSPTDLADTMVARMDGAPFPADRELARETSRRLDLWARSVTDPGRSSLVVRLDPPGARAVWLLSVQAHAGGSTSVPLDTAPPIGRQSNGDERVGSPSADAARLRSIQVVDTRPGRADQDEAWEFMSRWGRC